MSLQQIETKHWLLNLVTSEKRVYAEMRSEEDRFLQHCQLLNMIVLEGPRRQRLVLVPDGQAQPYVDVDFYKNWASVLANAASEQQKSNTIGIRSSQPPMWLCPISGCWTSTRPSLLANKVKFRINDAIRGSIISAAEALGYLERRSKEARLLVGNSVRAGQKSRAEIQQEKVNIFDITISSLKNIIKEANLEGKEVLAQVTSGLAWHLRARFENKSAISFSVPSVCLLSCVSNVSVEKAHFRVRESEDETILLPPLRLTIRTRR